jgi:hypothetical protein
MINYIGMKNTKYVLLFVGMTLLVACESKTNEETTTANQAIELDENVDAIDYQTVWDEFVQVVLTGTKSDVMSYLDPSNDDIQNEVALGFEYYFDEDLREKLISLSYAELEDGDYGDKTAKVLVIHHDYIIDGMTLESSYVYYFGFTPQGLIIYDILIAG